MPSLRKARRRRFGLSSDEHALIGGVIAIKAVLFVFGGLVFQILNNQALHSVHDFLGIWNRWDGPHYLDLAQNGYQATGENSILLVFYPLYPWIVRLFTFVFRDTYGSALAVSTLASLALAVMLYRLVLLDYSRRIAWSAVWFLFIFPTSYFLHVDYTESLFLAVVVASFLAARRDRWLLAGVMGMLASLTHANGALLLPALAAEAFSRLWRDRHFNPRWLYIGLVPMGFLLYLFVNYRLTGDPLSFLRIAATHWVDKSVTPWEGIESSLNVARTYEPYSAQMMGIQVLFYVAIALIGTIFSTWTLRFSYSVWMATNWILFACQSWDLSMPRYVLGMFPMFILIALLARNRGWNAGITAWSLIWLGTFAGQFVVGHWAF